MSTVETVTAVVAALGGGTGIAQVITALRGTKREAKQASPAPASTVPDIAPYGPRDGASWSVFLGILACLLAAALVVVVGATTMPLDAAWIMALKWAVIGVAVPAIVVGGWSRYRPGKPGRSLVTLRVGAGFLAACGALVATLVAGVG